VFFIPSAVLDPASRTPDIGLMTSPAIPFPNPEKNPLTPYKIIKIKEILPFYQLLRKV